MDMEEDPADAGGGLEEALENELEEAMDGDDGDAMGLISEGMQAPYGGNDDF
jgi:hypothetical protein